MGAVEKAVREDIEALGDLVGMEPSLAATAYRLAQALDSGEQDHLRQMHALARELRLTLEKLAGGRAQDDDEFGDLATPS